MPRDALRYVSICALAILAVLLTGCSRQIQRTDIRSPNGQLILRIEINESGGAAVPDVTSAYVFPSGSSSAHEKIVFRGSAMSYFNASWGGPEEVVVSFRGGYLTTCNSSVVVPPEFKITVLGCK